jgi:hypothetical protein
MMSTTDERNINTVEEMIRIAQSFLNLELWGFKESYHAENPGKLIYDSTTCRVSLIWGGWDPLGGNNINIRYGRLHAPNEKATMIWTGEECHCWHRFEHVLHFLDGRAPADAVKLSFSHPITDSFYESEFRQKFHRRQPEWLARMHAVVWQHYDKRFFELFDLHRPDLWQQYQQFLKRYYDLEGRIPGIKPSLDKVC